MPATPHTTPSVEDLIDARLADYRAILLRAHQDHAFQSALLANPARALQATFGITLPAGMTLSVVQETVSHSVLVLPLDISGPHFGLPADELSDSDLEAVAAGSRPNCSTPLNTNDPKASDSFLRRG